MLAKHGHYFELVYPCTPFLTLTMPPSCHCAPPALSTFSYIPQKQFLFIPLYTSQHIWYPCIPSLTHTAPHVHPRTPVHTFWSPHTASCTQPPWPVRHFLCITLHPSHIPFWPKWCSHNLCTTLYIFHDGEDMKCTVHMGVQEVVQEVTQRFRACGVLYRLGNICSIQKSNCAGQRGCTMVLKKCLGMERGHGNTTLVRTGVWSVQGFTKGTVLGRRGVQKCTSG